MTRIASLCSGYEGIGLGLAEALGIDLAESLAWHAENDDAPARVHEHHFPGIPNYRDIKTTCWPLCEPVDWLTERVFILAPNAFGEQRPWGQRIGATAIWKGRSVYRADGTKIQTNLNALPQLLERSGATPMRSHGGSESPVPQQCAEAVRHLMSAP